MGTYEKRLKEFFQQQYGMSEVDAHIAVRKRLEKEGVTPGTEWRINEKESVNVDHHGCLSPTAKIPVQKSSIRLDFGSFKRTIRWFLGKEPKTNLCLTSDIKAINKKLNIKK